MTIQVLNRISSVTVRLMHHIFDTTIYWIKTSGRQTDFRADFTNILNTVLDTGPTLDAPIQRVGENSFQEKLLMGYC